MFTILFGTTKFKLTYSEYVTILSLMGFLTGVTLFSWMVVFTFRKNLLMVAKYSLAPVQNTGIHISLIYNTYLNTLDASVYFTVDITLDILAVCDLL